jgi:hypothetical protein
MKETIFLLGHDFHTVKQPDNGRYIGAYSTLAAATEAEERAKLLPGFKDFPHGFTIDEYQLDQDHWTGGFTTIE